MAIRHPKGDLAPSWTDTITLDGAAPGSEFAGASVKFQARFAGEQSLAIDGDAVFVSSSAGTVRYDPAAGDVDTEGDLVFWWLVTLTGGKTLRTPEDILQITPPLGRASQLCEVEEVRALLRKDSDERGSDPQIERLILAASRAIIADSGREFAPAQTALARRFLVDPCRRVRRGSASVIRVELAPFDLRAATTVKLNPEAASPTTLTADVDYQLSPRTSADGIYTSVLLPASLTLSSDLQGVFGLGQLEITGNWGWPAVPADVRYAAALTAATWHRSYLAVYSEGYNPDEVVLERPEALTTAVKRLLDPYRRARFL